MDESGNRFMKKHHAKKAGMPPGSIIYVGDGNPSPTVVSLIDFTEADVMEKKGITLEGARKAIAAQPWSGSV